MQTVKTLASKYVDISKMFYVSVGDAKTQLPMFKNLRIEKILLVDENLKAMTKSGKTL